MLIAGSGVLAVIRSSRRLSNDHPRIRRNTALEAVPTRASVTCDAVDPLPDEVGVAVVARILLDHVQVDPADVPGALWVVPVAGHDVIKLLSGHGSAGVLYFLLEGLDVGG